MQPARRKGLTELEPTAGPQVDFRPRSRPASGRDRGIRILVSRPFAHHALVVKAASDLVDAPTRSRAVAATVVAPGEWSFQMQWFRGSLVVAVLVAGCADEEAPESAPAGEAAPTDGKGDGKADGASGRLVYSSATSVEALKEDLRSVQPPVRKVFVGDALNPAVYLRTMSCLGYFGPIGPYGPLGLLGPVGENIWNPSRYVSGGVDWHLFSNTLTESGGPLSADGPLGAQGPLNPATWTALGKPEGRGRTYADDFIGQLAPGGGLVGAGAHRSAGAARSPGAAGSGGGARLPGR